MRVHLRLCSVLLATIGLAGCNSNPPANQPSADVPAKPAYFKPDPASAGSISGTLVYIGKKPAPTLIDIGQDPSCASAHKGKAYDESLVVDNKGHLGNAFVYIKNGLEGKAFEVPASPVVIDQSGCWFHPRVLGIMVGQELKVTNSDPVTHNIHPVAVTNREWNHSQGPGDAPLERRFSKPEVMIPVKCNIHGWMHAYIGVVENPYFAVTNADGSFTIGNLPSGTYTVAVWHEKLGTQEQQVTVRPKGDTAVRFSFKRE